MPALGRYPAKSGLLSWRRRSTRSHLSRLQLNSNHRIDATERPVTERVLSERFTLELILRHAIHPQRVGVVGIGPYETFLRIQRVSATDERVLD